MNISKKTIIAMALLGTLALLNSFADEALAQERGRRPQGPPPEAYTACEGKAAGDTAEFVSPHGDTVTGICEEMEVRLVLRPDHPKKDFAGKAKESESN